MIFKKGDNKKAVLIFQKVDKKKLSRETFMTVQELNVNFTDCFIQIYFKFQEKFGTLEDELKNKIEVKFEHGLKTKVPKSFHI